MDSDKERTPQYHTDFAAWWIRAGMITMVKGVGGRHLPRLPWHYGDLLISTQVVTLSMRSYSISYRSSRYVLVSSVRSYTVE